MICFAKPGLTEDLCNILSSEMILHKEYGRKGSVAKKSLVVTSRAWRQDEQIGGKLPFVK
jgi:hypothetical protein